MTIVMNREKQREVNNTVELGLAPWAPLPSGGDAVEAFSSEMLAG